MHDETSRSIRHHLEAMARAIGWWRFVRAVGQFVSLVLLAAFLCASIDWWLRHEGAIGRWGLSLSLLAAVVVSFQRTLWPVIRERAELLWIATQLERCVGELPRGELVAGVSLALAPVERQSTSLTSEVLERTWSRLKPTSTSELIAWPAVLWPIAFATFLVAAIIGISLASPGQTGVATMRLLNPTGSYRWPTRFELVFEEFPTIVAANKPSTIVIANRRTRSPVEVRLLWESLESGSESGELTARVDAGRYRFELPGFETDVRIRGIAGDGDTQWRRLRVAAAPQTVEWIVTCLPPECLAEPVKTLGPSAIVPVDSSISTVGSLSIPIREATLHVDSTTESVQIPLSVAADGLSFRSLTDSPWRVVSDATYSVHFVGNNGLAGQSESQELVAAPNPPPQLVWSDEELRVEEAVLLTRDSIWPIELEVRDNEGVAEITIEAAVVTASELGSRQESDWIWNQLWTHSTELETTDATLPAVLSLELSANALAALAPAEDQIVFLRASAIDRCGVRAYSPRSAVKVVEREVYLRGLEETWSDWLSDAQSWTEAIAEFRRVAQSLSTPQATEGERGAAQTRVLRWVDQCRSGDSSLSGRLARLERLLARQSLTLEPFSQQLQQISAALSEVQPLIDQQLEKYQAAIRPSAEQPVNSDAAPSDLIANVWSDIIARWNTIETRLRDAFRRDEIPDWEQWSRELTTNLATQESLLEETLDLVGTVENNEQRVAAIRTLADRQLALSIQLERLEQQVSGEVERSTRAAWLLEQLRKHVPAVWQREAATKLQANQLSPATEAQRSAIEGLRSILGEAEQAATSEDPMRAFHEATRRMAAVSQDLGLSQRMADELRAWRAVDPSLSNNERRERMSGRLRAQSQRLSSQARRMIEQSGNYDLPQSLQQAASELDQAAQDIDAQQGEAAQANLNEAIEQLKVAMEQAGEEVAAAGAGEASEGDPNSTSASSEESSPDDATIEATLVTWIERQRGIAEELVTPQEIFADVSKLEPWAQWLRTISQSQEDLRLEIESTLSLIAFEQRPVLQTELRNIMRDMNRLSTELVQTSERGLAEQSLEPMAVAEHGKLAERLTEQLLYLAYEPPPKNTQEEQPGLSNPNEQPENEGNQRSLPGFLRSEISRLRMAQSDVLDQVRELNAASSDSEPILRLAARQRELEQLAQQLDQLIEQAMNQPSTQPNTNDPATIPGLPGQSLPGLPGLPGQNPVPANEGEDLGARKNPWEDVVVGMDEAALRLERGDDSPVTQAVMEQVIESMDQWLGGAPSPMQPPGGAAGTTGSSIAGVESAVQSQGEGTGLLTIDQIQERSSGVWGHLPEQLRESLQGISGDGWIQGFEDVSSHYFSELSGQEE